MSDPQDDRQRAREKEAIRGMVLAAVEYFIGDYSLRTIMFALFLGSSGLFQVARKMPPDWQTPEGYALLAMGFFGPVAAWLFIVSGYRWCRYQNNRPTLTIRGHSGWFDAGIRVTLAGMDSKVWLEVTIVENSGGYRFASLPFTPTWTYEGDAQIVRDQTHGTDAHLSNGKGASVLLAKVSYPQQRTSEGEFEKATLAVFRLPMMPGADHAQPFSYLPLLAPSGGKWVYAQDESWVTYRVRAVSTPPLKEPCDLLVRVDFNRYNGFAISVSSPRGNDGSTNKGIPGIP